MKPRFGDICFLLPGLFQCVGLAKSKRQASQKLKSCTFLQVVPTTLTYPNKVAWNGINARWTKSFAAKHEGTRQNWRNQWVSSLHTKSHQVDLPFLPTSYWPSWAPKKQTKNKHGCFWWSLPTKHHGFHAKKNTSAKKPCQWWSLHATHATHDP